MGKNSKNARSRNQMNGSALRRQSLRRLNKGLQLRRSRRTRRTRRPRRPRRTRRPRTSRSRTRRPRTRRPRTRRSRAQGGGKCGKNHQHGG